jgi:hypothetical protein
MKNFMYVLLCALIVAAGIWVTVERQRNSFQQFHSEIPDSVFRDTIERDTDVHKPWLRNLLKDSKVKYVGISSADSGAMYIVKVTDSSYHVDRYVGESSVDKAGKLPERTKKKIQWQTVWDRPILYHLVSNDTIGSINIKADSAWSLFPNDTITIHTQGNFLFDGPENKSYENLILRVILQEELDHSKFDTIYFNPYQQRKAWEQATQK